MLRVTKCLVRELKLSSAAGGEDQVAAALAKITEHISSAKKFRRASPLLRQLLQDGKVLRQHAGLLFQVGQAFGLFPRVCPGFLLPAW